MHPVDSPQQSAEHLADYISIRRTQELQDTAESTRSTINLIEMSASERSEAPLLYLHLEKSCSSMDNAPGCTCALIFSRVHDVCMTQKNTAQDGYAALFWAVQSRSSSHVCTKAAATSDPSGARQVKSSTVKYSRANLWGRGGCVRSFST